MSRSWASIEKRLKEAERVHEDAKIRRAMTLTLYKRNGETTSLRARGSIDATASFIEYYLDFLSGEHRPDEVVKIRNDTTGEVYDFEKWVEEADEEERKFHEWLEKQGYIAKEIFSDEWE